MRKLRHKKVKEFVHSHTNSHQENANNILGSAYAVHGQVRPLFKKELERSHLDGHLSRFMEALIWIPELFKKSR